MSSRSDSLTSSPSSTSSSMMTSSAQLRKIKKPLIERRRRERINICLSQLKCLVLEANNKNESCYSKMEKADILEMTVAHLKSMQQRCHFVNDSGIKNVDSGGARFLSGFRECAIEVQKYLTTTNLPDQESAQEKQSLVKYLENRIEEVQKVFREKSNDTKNPPLVQKRPHSRNNAEALTTEDYLPAFRMIPSSLKTAVTIQNSLPSVVPPTSSSYLLLCDTSVTRPHLVFDLKQQPFSAAVTPNIKHISPTTSSSFSHLNSRNRMRSPTEGDEFPLQTISPESSAVLFASSFEPKAEPKNQLNNKTSNSFADVWRPWARDQQK